MCILGNNTLELRQGQVVFLWTASNSGALRGEIPEDLDGLRTDRGVGLRIYPFAIGQCLEGARSQRMHWCPLTCSCQMSDWRYGAEQIHKAAKSLSAGYFLVLLSSTRCLFLVRYDYRRIRGESHALAVDVAEPDCHRSVGSRIECSYSLATLFGLHVAI